MTDYNTMTAQQCADWLAERDGWRKVQTERGDYAWRHKTLLSDPCSNWGHPFPLTLDAAAAALPANMFYYVNYCILFGEETYVVCAVTKGTRIKEFRAEAPDELIARYRAAVAARMEDER